jgi:aminoglycoside 2'-N-acetyltransferase I
MPLSIEIVPSQSATPAMREEIRALCSLAYDEEFAPYLADIGPGVHLLGRLGPLLVAHVMWVPRWLQPGAGPRLRTAYVEAVATHPSHQRRGFATELLARVAREIQDHDLGALSPSDAGFYARLGWQSWQGPLFIRTRDDQGETPTPDEEVMILRLPRTPPDLDLTAPLSAEWRPGELW